jgi:hypothetical protein
MRDQDHRRVERFELPLEPLEVADVEVVRRLVEEKQVGAARERARKRRARQLAAGEGAEGPIEVVLREAETANRGCGAIAPGPTARVLEASLSLRIAPERGVVVRALCHRQLERPELVLDREQVACAAQRVLAKRDVVVGHHGTRPPRQRL